VPTGAMGRWSPRPRFEDFGLGLAKPARKEVISDWKSEMEAVLLEGTTDGSPTYRRRQSFPARTHFGECGPAYIWDRVRGPKFAPSPLVRSELEPGNVLLAGWAPVRPRSL